jgi:hypothetical protein
VLSASQICGHKRFSRQSKCLSLSTKSEKRDVKEGRGGLCSDFYGVCGYSDGNQKPSLIKNVIF